MAAKKYGYEIEKQTTSPPTNTRHVVVNVYWLGIHGDEYGTDDKRLFSLRWQADRFPKPDGTARYWYGMGLKLQDPGDIEELNHQVRMVRKLLPDYGWFGHTPEEFIETCEDKRIRRVVYDSRLHRHITLVQVPDLELDRWMAMDVGGNTSLVATLAFNEDDAKSKLVREFINTENEYQLARRTDQLESWIQRGKPVQNCAHRTYGSRAPEIVSTDEMIKLDEIEEEVHA